jgi:hypothetical protein
MNENDLRDCFAMFAILAKGFVDKEADAQRCYEIADAMLEARNKVEDDGGIATIKKRKYVRKD